VGEKQVLANGCIAPGVKLPPVSTSLTTQK